MLPSKVESLFGSEDASKAQENNHLTAFFLANVSKIHVSGILNLETMIKYIHVNIMRVLQNCTFAYFREVKQTHKTYEMYVWARKVPK